MARGYVYILVNPGLKKNLLKIGRTTRDPETRSDEISQGAGIPLPYYVAYSEETTDCERAERLIHEKLAYCRVNDSREFFVLPLSEAISHIREACESIVSTSELLENANGHLLNEEYEMAIPYWQQAAGRGSPEAQFYMWQMHQEGWGGLDDFNEGVKYLKTAATQGYPKAELELATYYAEQIIGGENYATQAAYWGKRAADHGLMEGATIVGNMYACERPGIEKDDREALYWFKKSAEEGDSYAQYQVGISYLCGFGTSVDHKLACAWLEKARASGYETPSELRLKNLYYFQNKKHLELGSVIAKMSAKIGRPYFIDGISIDQKSNAVCSEKSCNFRGAIRSGGKTYCVNHYVELLSNQCLTMP